MGTDDTAQFGQIIRVEIEAYKGDTNKKVISAWAEDKKGKRISKQSKASVEEKFTTQKLTLPIQLEPNCGSDFEDGKYAVVAEGLDGSDEERFDVGGITKAQCIEVKSNESSKKSVKDSKKEPKTLQSSGLHISIEEGLYSKQYPIRYGSPSSTRSSSTNCAHMLK